MIMLQLFFGMVVLSSLVYAVFRIRGAGRRISNTWTAVAVILVLTGIYLTLSQENTLSYFMTVRNWPGVEAKITENRITGNRALMPEIIFEYVIDSVRYEGRSDLNIPGFGNRSRRDQTARIILNTYPPGTILTIHYDPSHPSVSLLRTSPPWNLYGKMGFGLFLFGSGLVIVLLRSFPGRKST